MAYSINDQVGKIVADNYRYAAVFSKYGIDFCCRGNRTIEEVSMQNNLTADQILDELNKMDDYATGDQIDFQSWELDLLTDYIEKKHHRYIRKRVPEILPYLAKVVKVHGEAHPELLGIANEFDASVIELNAHMQKEELNLFPHIRNMVEAEISGKKLQTPIFDTVQNPIQTMMAEHDNEGVRFRKIRELSNDYVPPGDGCQTYRITFAMLEEFEQDIHHHIHLENNILFPKAARLEKNIQYT